MTQRIQFSAKAPLSAKAMSWTLAGMLLGAMFAAAAVVSAALG